MCELSLRSNGWLNDCDRNVLQFYAWIVLMFGDGAREEFISGTTEFGVAAAETMTREKPCGLAFGR